MTRDRPLVGIACMLGGVMLFSLNDVIQKLVADRSSAEAVLGVRSLMIVGFACAWFAATAPWRVLIPRRPGWQAARACAYLVTSFTFFEALRLQPLATTVAISMSSPLLMTALSVPLLGERVGRRRWTAVVAGFAGVVLVARPWIEGANAGPLFALASAASYAVMMVIGRRVGASESDAAQLVVVNLAVVAVCLPLVAAQGDWPDPGLAGALAAMALLVFGGQALTIRAFRVAPVGAIAPFHFTQIVWGTLFGWLIWDDHLPWPVWAGAGLIVGSGLYVAWRERVRAAVEDAGRRV